MRLHLFSTDASALALRGALPPGDEFTALIVPANRLASDKVLRLRTASPYPVHVHQRGALLPSGLSAADAAVSWLYSQIILPPDLGRYRLGILNMHGGKIPQYRGANVLNWAIANGEPEIGITWHGLVEAVDAGPIYAESTIPVGETDTAAAVRDAMLAEGARLFPEAWWRFRDGDPFRVPDPASGKVWPPRRPRDGLIDPGWPERRVRAMLRAQCPPWPPATVRIGERLVPVRRIVAHGASGAVPYRTAEGDLICLSGEPGEAC